MKRIMFAALVISAILAAAACQNSLTGPSGGPRQPAKDGTTDSTMEAADLLGTWEATKAEASSELKPGMTRNLVAEGGTVTLVIKGTGQSFGIAITDALYYTVTVSMPGTAPSVDSGLVHYWLGSKGPQIDFYPASLGSDPEYGEIPAFLAALNGSTLKLWDSGLTFLPYDFGWGTTPGMNGTMLDLEFIRK